MLLAVLLLVIIAILLFGAGPVAAALGSALVLLLAWIGLTVGLLTVDAWLEPLLRFAGWAVLLVGGTIAAGFALLGILRVWPYPVPSAPPVPPAPPTLDELLEGSGPLDPAGRAALEAERVRLTRRVAELRHEPWGQAEASVAQARLDRVRARLVINNQVV